MYKKKRYLDFILQSTIKKLQEKVPELLKEIPELPSLVLDALKQMNNISNIQNEQTKAIINQLKDNSNRQTSAIFSGKVLPLPISLIVGRVAYPNPQYLTMSCPIITVAVEP
jgi:ubiquinone biosynthesis protein